MERKILREEFETMEKDRQSLLSSLDQLNGELLTIPEGPNQWSVNQVLLHLISSEEGIVGYINKKMQAPSLPRNNFWCMIRSHLLSWFIKSPIRYGAPAVIASPSNEFSYDTLKTRFDQSRQKISELIGQIPEKHLGGQLFKHPLAGRLTALHTLHFIKLHNRRHSKQIKRILKTVKK